MSQPPPIPNQNKPIVDLVQEDLVERKRKGIETYGMALQAHNGRDALWDAYEEALDLAIYLRQAIEETKVIKEDPFVVGKKVKLLLSPYVTTRIGDIGTIVDVIKMPDSPCGNLLILDFSNLGITYGFYTNELEPYNE